MISLLLNMDVIEINLTTYHKEKKKSKKTSPVASNLEKAALVSYRVGQFRRGATPEVDVPKFDVNGKPLPINFFLIAIQEMKEGVMPLSVRRYLPNGDYEDWPVSDLIITGI